MGLAGQLVSQFKRQIASLELIPSDGGCFEVTVDDDLVYTKLGNGRFPEAGEVEKLVAARHSLSE